MTNAAAGTQINAKLDVMPEKSDTKKDWKKKMWIPEEKSVAAQLAKDENGESLEAIAQRVITNRPNIPTDGTLKGAISMAPFVYLKPFNRKTDKETRGWDNEAYDAITNYFWGKTQGIVVELGGLDGQRYSVSKDFLPLEWHRILMEASPQYARRGPKQSPDATFVFSAICNKQGNDKPQFVHYLRDTKGDGAINGIGEFMTKKFLKRFHRSVYAATDGGQDFGKVTDWKEWSRQQSKGQEVEKIPCIDLGTIFRSIGVQHVNFFMLDVEGGEMDVLKSVDWDNMLFDVLAVETDRQLRPPHYTEDVTEYLRQRGYIMDRTKGRNTWFHHTTFQPSRKDS